MDLARFAESLLLGVTVDEAERSVAVTVRTAIVRDKFTFMLRGIDRFLLDDMREQNVIDEIMIWDSSAARSDYHDTLAALVGAKAQAGSDDPFAQLVDNLSAEIMSGKKTLIQIVPVAGASIVGLAQEVVLTNGWPS